jgi:hypothetical protein
MAAERRIKKSDCLTDKKGAPTEIKVTPVKRRQPARVILLREQKKSVAVSLDFTKPVTKSAA